LWGVPQRPEYHPEIDTGVHLMMVLDMSAQLNASLPCGWPACFTIWQRHHAADVLPRHIGHEVRSAKLLQKICDRLRVPIDCRELADTVAREHGNIHRSAELNPAAVMRLLERCDAIRKPERMHQVLQACECDARGRLGFEHAKYPQATRLTRALDLTLRVRTADIAAQAQAEGLNGKLIGDRIQAARVQALQALDAPDADSTAA